MVDRTCKAAFAAALINSQPMGFYAPAQLVRDAREHGVQVLPVDVFGVVPDMDAIWAIARRHRLRQLRRLPRFDPRRGMTGLVTMPVSQASADQRRGRAGRREHDDQHEVVASRLDEPVGAPGAGERGVTGLHGVLRGVIHSAVPRPG